jgi:hypothetical protein
MEPIARCLGTAVMIAAVAWPLTSCGHQDAAETSPPRPGKTDPVSPPDLHGQALPTKQIPVLTADQAGRLTSTPWGLQGVRGRELYLQYEIGGGCDADRGVYVKQTSDRVLIGHYVHDTSAGNACTDEMKVGHGVVRLQAPLGSRSLVHTVVDVPW